MKSKIIRLIEATARVEIEDARALVETAKNTLPVSRKAVRKSHENYSVGDARGNVWDSIQRQIEVKPDLSVEDLYAHADERIAHFERGLVSMHTRPGIEAWLQAKRTISEIAARQA